MASSDSPKGMTHWLYDPEEGVTFFDNEEELHRAAKAAVEAYYDPVDGWHEAVRLVCGGILTLRAVMTYYEPRPPEDEFDEEGLDESGMWWDPDWRAKVVFECRPADQQDVHEDEEKNHE